MRLWQVCALRKYGGAEPLMQVDLDPSGQRCTNGVPWPVTFQLDQAIFQFQLHHGRPFSRASTRFRPLVSSFQGRNQDQLAGDATDTIGSFFSATRHLQLTSSSQISKGAAHRMVLVSNDHSLSALQEGTKISTKFSDHHYRPSLVALVDSWTCQRTLVYLCLSDVHCGNSWLRRGLNNEALAALLPSCEEAEAHNILSWLHHSLSVKMAAIWLVRPLPCRQRRKLMRQSSWACCCEGHWSCGIAPKCHSTHKIHQSRSY